MILRAIKLAAGLSLLATGLAFGQATEFGNVNVIQNDSGNVATSVTLTTGMGSSNNFSIVGGNRGDYDVSFGTLNDTANGIMLSSVIQNGRNNNAFGDTIGLFYATSATDINTVGKYFIPLFRTANGDEVNIDVSSAWFSYSHWLAGYVRNSTAANGGPNNTLTASAGINLGTQFVDNTGGVSTVNLTSLGGSSATGVLLVNHAKNEDNYALSRANGDGTFTIFVKDNGVDAAATEQDPVAFVYLPSSAVGTKQLVAMGRVNNDATTDVTGGTFTVTKSSTGQWFLSIPGHTNNTGVLMLSPENGGTVTRDNVVSAQWDGANSRWVIQSRDLISATAQPTLEDGGSAAEDIFSFAFFANINVAPTVSITSPATNSFFVPASYTIEATAADTDGTITHVQFLRNGVVVGSDNTAPYTFAEASVAPGSYSYVARAFDNGDAVSSTAPKVITVSLDPNNLPANTALFFDGANDYVTMGAAPELNVSAPPSTGFTLECWFRKDGAGLTTTSGSGGVTGIPLFGKGRGESDGGNIDCNIFFGVTAAGVLVADFESQQSGLNHPITAANAPIVNGTWYHAAVTFDNATGVWKMYLNGTEVGTASVSVPGSIPRYDSIQHFGIGTAMDSSGSTAGAFAGAIDEARVWNYARSLAEIAGSKDAEVGSGTGLVARFGMNEGIGATTASTTSGISSGTLTNGPVWVEGAPFATVNASPTITLTAPLNGASSLMPFPVNFAASAVDADGSVVQVDFLVDGVKVGEDTSSPYSFAWSPPAVGTYAVSARAQDNLGASKFSGVANITVNPNPNQAPVVTLTAPSDGATISGISTLLQANLADPEGDAMTVTFYGRRTAPVAPGPDFTLVAIPDTQYYSEGSPGRANTVTVEQLIGTFGTQTQWVVDNKSARNIAFVAHMGDIVEHGNNGGNPVEWDRADAAMSKLENPVTTLLAHGIPYGVAPGNHDIDPIGAYDTGSTTFYNQYFGISRFAGRSYWGGNYGSDNTNSYQLFSASGLDFISIHMAYDTTPNTEILDWADALLKAHPHRRAIVTSHFILNQGNPAPFGAQGSGIYNALKDNPNLFLMLCGHIHAEGRRTDVFAGNTVHSVLSDYQGLQNGGNGFLRTFTFSPANNRIRVESWSPTLGRAASASDGLPHFDGTFDLTYNMQTPISDWVALGTVNVPAAGTTASLNWTGLDAGKDYEWYAAASDTINVASSSTRRFGTAVPVPPTVALTAPTSGATYLSPAAVNLAATANDTDGTVARVDFYQAGDKVGEDTTAPYEFSWTGVAPGNYTLTAHAVDSTGLITVSSPVNIVVNLGDIPPTVALTAPASGAVFEAPADITLTADATDPEAPVVKVQFFSGTVTPVLLGEDTSAPFSLSLPDLGPGNYTFTARATDSVAQTTTSTPVNISVFTEAPLPTVAGWSAGLFDIPAWSVAQTSPSPRQFDLPGTNVGDVELRINGTGVPFDSGITLASNWSSAVSGTGAQDNLCQPYVAVGNVFVSILDNSNNNAADANPGTSEESAGVSVAFLPYAHGWTGASVNASGGVINGNLPAGVTISRPGGGGVYAINGLSVAGNLLAFTNGDAGTLADNICSVRVVNGRWQIDTRDNAGGGQDNEFSFVYFPPGSNNIYAGKVSETGAVSNANAAARDLGVTATVGANGVDITFGDGTVINPSTAALFVVADSTNGGSTSTAVDNLTSFSANGNSFRIFTQDLPQVSGTHEPIDLRFVAIPFAPLPPQLLLTEISSNASVADFWELTNVGSTSVDLGNWKWDDDSRNPLDAAAVTIPAGTVIAPGESIIFTSAPASAFRTWWGISAAVQVISSPSAPGLGMNDGIALFDTSGVERFFFSYAAGGFTRSNGSAAAGGHAGVSAGGLATHSAVLDPTFGLVDRRYAAAAAGTFGAFASATNAADIGSPGTVGLGGGPTFTLTVSATPASFSESATNPASTGTVARSGSTTGALVVNLSSNDNTEASVPATVTIPSGQASANFDITAVDDSFPDGNKTVTLSATATSATPGTFNVTVQDDGDVNINTLILTEVLSSESNSAPSGAEDYWELTNYGSSAISLAGYTWHDNGRSYSTAAAWALPAGTSIAPGESVIFTAGDPAVFRAWWGITPATQVFRSVGAPGLGQNDGISLFDNGGNEIFFFNYAAGGFTREDGSPSTGGHAATSAGAPAETQAVIWVPSSGTSSPRYTFATGGNHNTFQAVSPATDSGSPGSRGVTDPTVSIANASVAEGNSGTTTLALNVTRSDTTTAFTVNYAVTSGSATSGTDYATLASGMLTFSASGAATQPIHITVNGDTTPEPDETIIVTLSNVVNTTGATALGAAEGTGTILNDDATAPVFTQHPLNSTVTTGSSFTLTATATGTPAPTYQWYQGPSGNTSNPIGGATQASFSTPGLATTTSYWVRATNSAGSADSSTATVTVVPVGTFVNLNTYVRVGRFDLPEPTRTTPPMAGNLLCQEASGVTYNWDTDTLFICGDGGKSITQVTKAGVLVNTMTLADGGSPQGTEFYDPEGITYIGGGQFVMSEERDRKLVKFTYVPNTTLSRSGAQTVQIGTFVPNTGTEGLSYDPMTSGFICLKEIDPMGLFQTGVDFAAGTATNGSPSTVNSTDLFDPALVGMTDFADVFALSNLPAMTGQSQQGSLLLLGQEDARVVVIDRNGNISSTLQIVADPGSPISATNQQHEGITMDRDGKIYVVNENGGGDIDHPQLWVYAPATAPNQAPTAIALNNATTSVAENSSTTSALKVADIAVTDDGLGTNTLSISGADASFFEITGAALFIKAGTVLDFETKTSYSITVSVDDTTLGSTPDASVNHTLNVTDVVNETPTVPPIIISEVAPWSSGNSPVAEDWIEITNTSNNTIDLTGWKVDDSSNNFSQGGFLNGVTSIAPGESVIFLLEVASGELAAKKTTFINNWFGGSAPVGLQIGSVDASGLGLSSGGDAVNVFNAAGVNQASVTFGASPGAAPFASFDNGVGLSNSAVSQLSVVGVNGAFTANGGNEIGSPGTTGKLFISEVSPWSSTAANSPVAVDWFELTNKTPRTIDLTGWKVDDSSASPLGGAAAIGGVSSIAPGESVIVFLEVSAVDLSTKSATFLNTWFGASPPAGLKIGHADGSGLGLGGGGDAVNVYSFDSLGAPTLRATVNFGASPASAPFKTFDNAAGLNDASITLLSTIGVNGAFAAANDANEIGSPGSSSAPSNVPPSIGTQPASLTITRGTSTTLSVVASGTPAPTYQWYQGTSPSTASPVSGATSATFTTPILLANTSYWVRVTNAAGTADSETAVITVTLAAAHSSANLDITVPNTASWNPDGVTVGGTQFINLGLQGVGRIPANMKDNATGESVGSISDMQVTNFSNNGNGSWSGTFHFLPDRGYNNGAIFSNYAARLNVFNFTFTPYTAAASTTAQNQIAMSFAGSTRFTYDHDNNAGTPGVFTTGLLADGTASRFGTVVPITTGNTTLSDGAIANRLTLDAEGLIFDNRIGKAGTGWIGDEYGAYIYHFNNQKQIDGVVQLPQALIPHAPVGTTNFNGTPLNGRRDNQGMEGIAQSPDGTRLFGLMQSATIQDSGSGNQGRFNTRLVVFNVGSNDTPTDAIAQYVIQLPRVDDTGSATNGTSVNRTAAQSSIIALNNNQLLILSRDGNGRGAAGAPVFKSILLADLSAATNIDGAFDGEGNAVSPAGALNASITPISWTEALNLLGKLNTDIAEVSKFGLNLNAAPGDINSISEKWEALSLVSANDSANPNDYFLFVGNDNDFMSGTGKYTDAAGNLQSYNAGLENDSIVLAYRVRIPGPEIVVEQPAASAISDTSSKTFGDVFLNTPTSLTFTIRNTGSANLNLGGLTKDGADAALFTVGAPGSSTLAPRASTTFNVQFLPTTAGLKNAVLHIPSNDGDEASFDIALSGNAVDAGTTKFVFEEDGYTVDEDEPTGKKVITVVRTGDATTTVSVHVVAVPSGATPSSDYTFAPVTLQFDAFGTNTKDVEAQIVNSPATSESNETFKLKLQNASGGQIGTPGEVPVTIVDSSSRTTDANRPGTPNVTAPAAAPAFTPVELNETTDVTGTAADNKGVDKVLVELNDSDEWVEASLGTPGGTSTTFVLPVEPLSGANKIRVKSVDFVGTESLIATRFFNVSRPLIVHITGGGTVTNGFSPDSNREVGKSFTITGTPTTSPPPGNIFTGWEIESSHVPADLGIADTALAKPTLTFIFREGLVLRAHFAPNPFAPVAGSYNGLINSSPTLPNRPLAEPDGTEPGLASEGHIQATVQSTGAFSGKLTIDGLVLNVAGTFDELGRARFGTARALTLAVPRPNKPSLMVKLDVALTAPFKITGEVTANDFRKGSLPEGVSTASANRAHYNGTNLMVPGRYLGLGNAASRFNIVFPRRDLASQPDRILDTGITEQDYPQGDGVGSVTITKNGVVTITGTLADGTAITATTALAQATGPNEVTTFPLFVSLYTAKGFVSGMVTLDTTQTTSDMEAADGLLWGRPFNGASHYYPFGWPEVVEVDMVGARYLVTANQSVLKATNGVNLQAPDTDGNVTLTFADGLLDATLVKSANLSTADAVTNVPSNDPTFTMTVNRTTGAITGTFDHTDDTKPAYNAIIFQKGPNAGAYGFFLTKQPVPIDYTGEGGGVTILGQP